MQTMRKPSVLLFIAVLTAACSSAAFADRYGHRHHHHYHGGARVHYGLMLGGPLWYPGPLYYPAPLYHPYPAYPPAVVVQSAPRVYIERDDQVAPQRSPGYWHYCRESDTYYPYVKQCAGNWERVPARPLTP